MKINRFFGIASLAMALSSSSLSAQYYYPVAVSGFTQDVIANGIGSALTSTTTSVDAVDFAYVSKDFQATATSPFFAYGLPVTGQFMTVNTSTPGLTFQLAPYTGSNALKLSVAGDSGTLTATTPVAAYNLYFLATGGSGSGVVSATVTFSDATTQVFTGLSVSDWYDQPNFAIQGIGRINIVTNAFEDGAGVNPRIYQIPLAISAANQTKTVQSVAFSKTSGTGFVNIFGISADKYTTCLAPTATAASAITAISATLSWTAPATAPISYDVYYTSSTVAPNTTTTPSISGITSTTTSIGGLSPLTRYHVWIRSNCSGNVGQWAYATNFKSACGAVTSLSENFDSYAASTTLPDCWVRNFVNGTMSISSTTPASGTRNIYQTNTATQTPSTVVLPEFSNINAGTHWLRFKARVSAATGTLNVGYVTNPTDPSTFVLIQALSLANTNYTSTNSEYGVIVPSTVPANARLAIKNTADGKGYYWDDVNWEVMPLCLPPTAVSTSAVTSNSVTASWTAPSSAPANGYEYYYSTTNTAPVAASTPSGTIAAGNVSSVISGFTPATTYYLWLRSSCSTTSKSAWVYFGSFSTLCAPVVPSYTNDFSTVPGNCWSNALSGGTPATGPSGTSSYWVSGGFLNTGTANSVRMNVYSTARTGWLKTNVFNLSGGGYRVKFDYGLTAYNSTSASTMGSDDNVQLLVSNDGGSTWTSLKIWTAGNEPTNTSSVYSLDLTGYNSANTVFAFYGTSGTVGDTQDYDFHIDNFTVESANLGTSESVATNKKLSIHPNPFKDVIYISETKDIKSVTVYDVAGRIVKQVNDASKEIHLAELKEGLYMIKVSFKDGTESVTKAIKK